MRRFLAWLLPPLTAAVLAGCAEVPPQPAVAVVPSPPTPPTGPRPRAADPVSPGVETWHKRALAAKASGDLAGAETAWHVLTLLAPEEPTFRRELADIRASIARELDAALQDAGGAARSGDVDRASMLYLRALALDPENADAARALRELDRRRLGRLQADRAARARVEESPPSPRAPRPPVAAAAAAAANGPGDDLDQGIEILNAGDATSGLRELRSWVEAHPQDRVGRHRAGSAVFDRGVELESRGAREQALSMYETAVALRGEPASGWAARMQSLRKSLSNEYYDRGTRAERSDLDAAVKALEASLRFDPGNSRAAARLTQARAALAKLRQIEAKSK